METSGVDFRRLDRDFQHKILPLTRRNMPSLERASVGFTVGWEAREEVWRQASQYQQIG
jgi:hypothetical protein